MSDTTAAPLRLGTRASALALWQAEHVADLLQRAGFAAEIVHISTIGDRDRSVPVGQIGGQGVFTKEVQRAVLDGRADLAVHSLKDLPTEATAGLTLAAVPQRGPAGDVLVSKDDVSLADLPQAARIGTGSLRRRAQLLHRRADLEMCEIRGNVETRLQKLDDSEYDAIVLAEAGITRLGLGERISQRLEIETMLPAVGQGALGLECRADDDRTRAALAALRHPATQQAVTAERAMLSRLQGGCLAPVAGYARLAEDPQRLGLTGVVVAADGSRRLCVEQEADLTDAVTLGEAVADALLSEGAADLISASRDDSTW